MGRLLEPVGNRHVGPLPQALTRSQSHLTGWTGRVLLATVAMSEFKFSCPACGQHLAGDVRYAGLQITCPTCQQNFTVPSPEPEAAPTITGSATAPSPPPPPRSPAAAPYSGPAAMPVAGRAPAKTSGLAVASLVCSCATVLVGPLGAIPGIICGHLARRQIKRDPSLGGRGLATAGLIVGYGLLAVFVGLITVWTLISVKHFKESMRQAAQPTVGVREPGEPAAARMPVAKDTGPDQSGWTLQLEGVEIPSQPAQGRLRGRSFTPDQVVMQNGWLIFRQGRDFFPDLELSVVLFQNDPNKLADRTFLVPGAPDTWPHVSLQWKEPGQALPQIQTLVDRYALRLEFGSIRDGKLPGKIYVCVADEAKSFLRGTFEAELKPAVPPPGGRPPRQRLPTGPPGKPKADRVPI